jgi:hypothetical protein
MVFGYFSDVLRKPLKTGTFLHCEDFHRRAGGVKLALKSDKGFAAVGASSGGFLHDLVMIVAIVGIVFTMGH